MRDSPDISQVLPGSQGVPRLRHPGRHAAHTSIQAEPGRRVQISARLFLAPISRVQYVSQGAGLVLWASQDPYFLKCLLQAYAQTWIKMWNDCSVTGQRWNVLSLRPWLPDLDVNISFSFLPISVTLLAFRPQTTFSPCLLRSLTKSLELWALWNSTVWWVPRRDVLGSHRGGEGALQALGLSAG